MKTPTPIDLSPEAVDQLKQTIQESKIDPKTCAILLGLIDFCLWLQFKLNESKISINRLKNLFGLAKKNNAEPITVPSTSQDECDSSHETRTTPHEKIESKNPTDSTRLKKRKGHGRHSAKDYTGATVEKIKHPKYQSGDLCPLECGGKLYITKAGQFIRIQGGSLVEATKYEIEKLRCNLCGELFAQKPPHDDKYDARAKAVIAVSRYQMGTPMYRLARFQSYVGIPLPEATQWQLILEVYQVAEIIFKTLIKAAAQVDLFFIDDTWVRILDIIRHNKQQTEKKNKKGTHTSGILAMQGGRKIFLYFSGTQHAGQNLTDVLAKRESNKIPIQMGDALSRNKVSNFEIIECHCIEHGKRNSLISPIIFRHNAKGLLLPSVKSTNLSRFALMKK